MGLRSILFIADPTSAHDIKWIRSFSDDPNLSCYLLCNESKIYPGLKEELAKIHIDLIGSIPFFSIKRFTTTFGQLKRIDGIIHENNIDAVHIMFAEPNSLWSLAKKKTPHVKWILTTRGTDVLKTIPRHLKNRSILNRVISHLYRKAFKQFDLVTSTSLPQLKAVKNINPISNPLLVRTGVDINSLIEHTPLLTKELQNKKFVLFPRSMAPIYNHEFSLKAIAGLSDQTHQEYTYVFIGNDSGDANYRELFKQKIAELATKNIHIKWLPQQNQSQIWSLTKLAQLVVMNPLSDGSPVSAMESMACGTPLILPPLNYDKDLFGDWVNYFGSWDPKLLSARIEQVLSMDTTSQSQKAKEVALKLANRTTEMSKLRDAIESLYLQS